MTMPTVVRDQELDELVAKIEAFCVALERANRAGPRRWAAVSRPALALAEVLERTLGALVSHFDRDAPKAVFARRMIEYGASALADSTVLRLWRDYFVAGASIEEFAHQSNFSMSSVRRRRASFAERVAMQLWAKNHELAFPDLAAKERHLPDPRTADQIELQALMSELKLTDRQAEVLLAFQRYGRQRTQETIAQGLDMTLNTLKTHRKRILRHLGVSSIRAAVWKAEEVLRALGHPREAPEQQAGVETPRDKGLRARDIGPGTRIRGIGG